VRAWVALLLLSLALLAAGRAAAHEVRPALLQITERADGGWRIQWKQPAMGEAMIRLEPHLSSGWLEAPPDTEYAAPGFVVRTWEVASRAPLDGQTLRIDGLRRSITDVLVQVELADGRRVEALVKPVNPTLRFRLAQAPAPSVPAYLKLGVEHILTGVDHLAFVLGLLLLVGANAGLVKAVTAFTVAHSVTLAAAALGWVNVPSALVESLVALSIVFVAAELLRPEPGLTRRRPWLVAFAFGLLHGLAFASALAEIGLPPTAVAASLLLFNIGVEVGQLMFVAVAVAAMLALRRLPLPRGAGLAPPYAIGSFAAFWFIERVAAVFA
jgi:hydrogenase/urease accessory protein HupE